MTALKKFLPLLLLFNLTQAMAQAQLKTLLDSMTKEQVWTALLNINSQGETVFGKCRISDAKNCGQCACAYYFNGKKLGSLGMTGWGKNPSSGDGTGCISWKGSPTQPINWPSSTGIVYSSDLKQFAKNILANAIDHGDVCNVPVPPTVNGGISVMDTSKFMFVNPKESCANGQILCGTPNLGGNVGSMVQFIKLSPSICAAAWGAAMKSKSNLAKMVSCNEYNSQALDKSVIDQAASMVGQMNTGYDVFQLAGIAEMLSMTDAQLKQLTPDKVALYYVAVGENSNKMPQAFTQGGQFDVNKLDTAYANPSDKWIKTDPHVIAARTQFAQISQGVVQKKSLSLEQAVQLCKVNDPLCSK
jgi:hypothetical protein